MKTDIFFHTTGEINHVSQTVDSILNQTTLPNRIYAFNENDSIDLSKDIVQISNSSSGFPGQFNIALAQSDADMILYIDNRMAPVSLSNSIISLLSISKARIPNTGMFYSDYDNMDNSKISEVRLLKHHQGRVRDNQDYGKVYLFDKKVLDSIGGMDESIQFNHFYDLRLKISEKSKLTHIANRYSGSLYSIQTESKSSNVFDYLLAGKAQQEEAESILSNHLDRMGSFLSPDSNLNQVPNEDAQLTATIIIPVNDRPEFIGTAIDSILAQTVQDIEVIVVVNGGKDDPTIPAVKNYLDGGSNYDSNAPKVRLLVTDINNIGYCLNLGAQNANGKYYVQLDSDDRLKSDAVEKIVDLYKSDSTIGMVIGSYEVWEKADDGSLSRMEEIPVVTHDEWTDNNGRNNLLRINGAGAPRSIPIQVIKNIGFFEMNETPFARNYGEDYDMVLRISENYRIGRIYDPIYEVIRHSGGTDHAIDQIVIDRNDEAKDHMRLDAIQRRKTLNLK